MIAYLKGQPIIQTDKLILLVNGVGYDVQVGSKVWQQANQRASQKQELELFIHTYVKEDKLELYGFSSSQEQQLFEMVLSVSGVGPKIALALINAGPEQLVESVQQAKLSFFTAVPRVGKKLAQKIIIELKSKLGSLRELNLEPLSQSEQDLMAALTQMGFDENEVRDLITQLNLDLEKISLAAAIKIVLKKVGKA